MNCNNGRPAWASAGMILIAVAVLMVLSGRGMAWAAEPAEADDPPPAVRIARSMPRPTDALGPLQWALNVTIRRDAYGVPHIEGKDDESVTFGFAYAQAEDYFWQVEDSYILALGRCAEVHGSRGLNSDLLNRAFEIVPRSQADFAKMSPDVQGICRAFAAGLNYYLATHPEIEPRLIHHFEPWHVVAFRRHMVLELCYRYTRLSHNFLPRGNKRIWAARGSNGWAINGNRTASGGAMLMVNPHMPWFGLGQMVEAHLRSDSGLNFTGAAFYGSPMLSIGHNEHLGWTMTVNEPDVADVWRETFDDPDHPLRYRYGNGYRTAHQWHETIGVRMRSGIKQERFSFLKTHHGPVVEKVDDQTYLTARISGLHGTGLMQQTLAMVKARDLDEFQAAVATLAMPIMNIVYADCEGNIYYVYGGRIPRRDPAYDWSQPVDGSDPGTEWHGIHPLAELPQVLNPPSEFIQSCNSTPFTTTDGVTLDRHAFPPYMIEDKDADKRRAKRSREILRALDKTTLEQLGKAAVDTTVYWAKHELPHYAQRLEHLKKTDPVLARKVAPLLDHLLNWDCRLTPASTQASLCEAWYETLYGTEYPGETLRPRYQDNPAQQLAALVHAASSLRTMHGDWRVPYGAIHRIQRPPHVADVPEARFDDAAASLPATGGHGPMGVIFTQYYTPSIHIPLIMSQKKRYGVVGATYLAVYQFGPDGVRGASVVPFGQDGEPEAPHYLDQAQLLSEGKMKPILYTPAEVDAGTRRCYHPGQ
jgi:acyl-homoserine-lactone acylase